MFDAQMKLNGVMHNGEKVTADYLSTLAQEDLPQAVELLSQLYTKGQLSIQTLTKMMTSRHAPYIISQLQLMNGNINQYIDSMTKGASVQEDFEKGIQSFSNQWRILKNNTGSLSEYFSNFADVIGADVVEALNVLLEGMRSMQSETNMATIILGGMADSAITMSIALTTLIPTAFIAIRAIKGFKKEVAGAFGMSGTMFIGISIALTAIIGIYSIMKRIDIEKQRSLELDEQLIKKTEKQLELNEALYDRLEAQREILHKLSKTDLTEQWKEAYDMIGAVTEKSSELKSILEATKNINAFKFPELKNNNALISESIQLLKDQKSQIEESSLENNKKYKKEKSSLSQVILGYRKMIEVGEYNAVIKQRASQTNVSQETFVLKQIKIIEAKKSALRKEYIDKSTKDNEEYYSIKSQLALQDLKVSESILSNAYKFTNVASSTSEFLDDRGITSSFKLISDFINKHEGEGLLGSLAKADEATLKAIYGELPKEAVENLNQLQFLELVKKSDKAQMTKINQEAQKLMSYYEQIASITSSMKYEAFTKIVNKKNLKDIESYRDIIKDFKFDEIGKGIDKLDLVPAELNKLIEDGNLLKAIADTDSFAKAISELTESTKKVGADKAISDLSENAPELFKELSKGYDGVKENSKEFVSYLIEGLKKAKDLRLEAMLAVDTSGIKSSFYNDEDERRRLEALKIQQKGLALLKTERDLLSLTTKEREKKYEFERKAIDAEGKFKGKDLRAEETRFVESKTKGTSEVRDFAILQKLMKLELENEAKKNDEANKGLTITVKTAETIKKASDETSKIIENYKKINQQNLMYADLAKLIGKETEKTVMAEVEAEITKYGNLKSQIDALSALEAQTGTQIDMVNSLEQEKELSKTKIDNLKKMLKYLVDFGKLQKEVATNLKKADEIRKNTVDLSKNEYMLMIEKVNLSHSEIENLENKLKNEDDVVKKSKIELELAQARYDSEVAINTQLAKRNDLIDQSMTGMNSIVNALSGVDSGLSKGFGSLQSISTLFTGGAFKDMSSGFSLFKSSMSRNQISGTGGGMPADIASKMGGVMTGGSGAGQLAGMASMLGGAGAVAGVGMAVADTITGIEDAKAQKSLQRHKERMEIAQKQLDAFKSMSNSFKSYTDQMVETLTKMPTKNQYDRQMEQAEKTVKNIQSRDFGISGLTGTREGGKAYFGGGRETKGYSASADRLVKEFGYSSVNDMSIDDAKTLIEQMNEISDWNSWIKKNIGTGGGKVKSSNIDQIKSQIQEQIDVANNADRFLKDLMTEATVTAFKGSSYINQEEMRKEFRAQGEEMFYKMVEGEKVINQSQVTEFIEDQMAGIGKIATDSAINIRNALIDGIASGADSDTTIASAFRSMFDDMAYNVSSIMTDTLFQDIYDDIEANTIAFTNKLVELKDQFGKDSTGMSDTLTKALEAEYIPNMITAIKATQELDKATMDFNSTMRENLMLEVEKGELTQEFVDMMYPLETTMSKTANSIQDMFTEALKADNYSDSISMLGQSISSTLIDSMINTALSANFNKEILALSEQMSNVVNQGFNISATSALQSEFNKAMLQMEQTQQQANILKDILTFDSGDVEYERVNNDTQYQTGSTQSIINNITNSYRFDVGTLVGNTDASMHEFSIAIKPYLDSLT